MELRPEAESRLRDYLLGVLSPEQQEKVELWLISEETAYDLLVAAEDALIEDSLAGSLTKSELSSFNNYFLAAPERQRKLRFGRSLKGLIKAKIQDSTSAGIPASRGPSTFSVRSALAQCFRYQPATSYAVAALIVLMVAGSVFFAMTTVQLRRDLDVTTSQLKGAEKFEAQLATLERIVGSVKNVDPSQGLLTFDLIPGLTRSAADIREVTLTDKPDAILLMSLTLDGDAYKSYRVVLYGPDEREKFTRVGLSAIHTADGKAFVVVSVPNGELSALGTDRLQLIGVSEAGQPEYISSYSFRPTRR